MANWILWLALDSSFGDHVIWQNKKLKPKDSDKYVSTMPHVFKPNLNIPRPCPMYLNQIYNVSIFGFNFFILSNNMVSKTGAQATKIDLPLTTFFDAKWIRSITDWAQLICSKLTNSSTRQYLELLTKVFSLVGSKNWS
jgi:hypothetical protein